MRCAGDLEWKKESSFANELDPAVLPPYWSLSLCTPRAENRNGVAALGPETSVHFTSPTAAYLSNETGLGHPCPGRDLNRARQTRHTNPTELRSTTGRPGKHGPANAPQKSPLTHSRPRRAGWGWDMRHAQRPEGRIGTAREVPKARGAFQSVAWSSQALPCTCSPHPPSLWKARGALFGATCRSSGTGLAHWTRRLGTHFQIARDSAELAQAVAGTQSGSAQPRGPVPF